jgi:putative nucleotidyltransferase with HDIG domain
MGQEALIAHSDTEMRPKLPPFGNPSDNLPMTMPSNEIDTKSPPGQKSRRRSSSMVVAYQDWRDYRKEIPELIMTAEKNLLWIDAALTEYRMTFVELSYKLDSVDDEVWNLYNEIRIEFPQLNKETNRRPLVLRSRTTLLELRNSWQELISKQEKQLDLLSKAPESLRFYNSTQLLRKNLADERARRAENTKLVSQAREGLERSLVDLADRDLMVEPIAIGSKILRLEDCQRVWKIKLDEIRSYEKTDINDPEEVLTQIQKLNDTIKDAPVTARWIRALEAKLSNLLASHEVLESLGKTVVPQSEIARATVTLYELVPKLWMSGENEELDRNLQSLERFITLNEDAVRREVEIAEKRRPGITQALYLGMEGVTGGLNSLIILARSMVHAVDSRDRFMSGHSEEVTELAVKTARRMNWSGIELEYLELAGLLHDVGKLSIPEAILSKTSPLTAEERTIIEKHPTYGANILKPVKGLNRIVPWVYHHQERWDGAGYPDHISRRDIPLPASIIGLAEAFTVMTTKMPYREPVSKQDALEMVKAEAGKQFNPEVVEAFVETVDEQPNELASNKMAGNE